MCTSLDAITLTNCLHLTSATISFICDNCDGLKRLVLDGIDWLQDNDIRSIANSSFVTNLTRLSICDAFNVSGMFYYINYYAK